MNNINIVDLFKAKVHFGHLKNFVSPKMVKYIYHVNNKISIINLDLTLELLKKSLVFIEDIVKKDGTILFVGTKKQAKKVIGEYAIKMNMPYVNFRWLGGILTNYKTISHSIKKLRNLQENMDNNSLKHLTKKENLSLCRELAKLKLNLDGIKAMKSLPDALFIVDVNCENTAVLEAKKLGIPVIGIVDTNSDPDNIDFLIPGNDDSVESIKFYLEVVLRCVTKVRLNKVSK